MEYRNELLKVKIEDYVAVVMIDHPPLNILTLSLSAEMQETFHRLEEDTEVRVIVLRGSGEKAFCVGADIKEFPQVWDDVIGKKLRNENLAIDGIELLDKPVIAAMEGNVLGGGCEIAMACDIRFMSETGKIGCPEINLGVFPGSGGLYRMARYIGIARAYEMLYTGKTISAQEACQIGLVNHVVPAGKTEEEAVKLARVIADKPFEAIKLIKKGVRQLWQKTTEENFYPNLELSRTVFQTPDCAEGVDAFINKRPPHFQK
ncbi:MAG: enoyl-CoA hydratase/isomerase family protein [Lachnospiraceae bacterium]|jgi:enoyl-CoA hydratase|nr:enoyl-CoA hydratase/isomerase family protein [Lachnospiraceae bacterium]